MKGYKVIIYSLIVLVFSASCEDEDQVNNDLLVETNSIIFASSTRVIIQGSILSLKGETVAEDYGFEISLNENFGESTEYSLGQRSGLGRFIGKIGDLKQDRTYYARSYVILSGERATGTVITFRTQRPSVTDFSPRIGDEAEEITIFGTNLPDSLEVFFGEVKANVQSNLFNSKLVVTAPKFNGDLNVPIRLVMADSSVIAPREFEYVSGSWGLTSTFPSDLYDKPFGEPEKNYFASLGITDGNKIVFGLGFDATRNSTTDAWTFNMEDGEWGRLNYSGSPARHPFQFDNKFGGGRQRVFFGVPEYNNEFWEVVDGEFRLISSFPFDTYQTVGFDLNGTYYVFGGVNEILGAPPELPRNQRLRPVVPIYRFDGSEWKQTEKTVTGPVSVEAELPNFEINDIAYFIDREGSLYSFDESTETWEFKNKYPGELGYNGLAEVVAGKAYVGLLSGARDIWAYDPEVNEWKRKRIFPARSYGQVVAAGVYNNRIYVIRNPTVVDFENDFPVVTRRMEVWIFNPEIL